MKVQKKLLIKIGLGLLLGGGLIFALISYQGQQESIVAEKEEMEKAILAKEAEEKEKEAEENERWQVFYDLSLTGIENFVVDQVVVSETGRMALLDKSLEEILLIDEEKKSFGRIKKPETSEKIAAITWDGEGLVAMVGELYEYDEKKMSWEKLTTSLMKISGASKEEAAGINLLEKFDENYYWLNDKALRKIKMATKTGAESVENWLAEDSSLTKPVIDMWIDGYIYVSDGEGIKKYARGEKMKWAIKETTTGAAYLAKGEENWWILWPEAGEVWRVNENGEKTAMWQNKELSGTRFIWLNQDKTRGLTIKGNLIYSFTLP